MERIIKFGVLAGINLVAAAIAIMLAGGQPFGSMSGWGGVALLVGIVLGVGVLFWIFVTLIGGTYDKQRVMGLAALSTVAVVIALLFFGTVGISWLYELRALLSSGGIWWPVVILIASAIGLLLLSPKRRRATRR